MNKTKKTVEIKSREIGGYEQNMQSRHKELDLLTIVLSSFISFVISDL